MDENHFMTHRMVTYIRQEALRRTCVSLADEVGVVESTIRVIFSEYAATCKSKINQLLV
jgi:transposase